MPRAASRLSLIVIVALCLQPFGLAQEASPDDETALRAVAEELFAAYGKKDLEGLMGLWSLKSPELATRRKAIQEFFAANEKIEVRSLTVSGVKVEGDKASLRATVEMSATEAKTGKPAGGFVRMNRALDFVKEEGRWKVWREVSAEEDLAAALVAAQTDNERDVLLAAEKELLTETLWRALNRLGRRSAAIGRQSEALKAYGLALSIAERIGDEAGIAAARNNIGLVYLSQGDYETALTYLRESLRLHQAQGNKLLIAQTMNSIGSAYKFQGDYRSALEHSDKSLKLNEEVGNKAGIVLSLNQLGGIYKDQGNYELALDYHQRALRLSEESGNKIGIADSLHEIGSIHLLQGNFSEALVYLQRNVELLEALQHKAGIAYLLGNMGLVHYRQGDYPSALKLFQKTLELSESVGDKRGVAMTFYHFASVYYSSGDYSRSLEYAERTAEVADQMGHRELFWRGRSAAGKASRALGQYAPARLAFEEAIATVESLRSQIAGGEQEQQRFFENKISPYHSMVELLVGQNKIGEALAYAERAKARVLLDVLQSGKGDITKAMTAQERERERRLRSEQVSFNSQVSRESLVPQPEQTRLAALKARLQKARLEYEAFQTSLYAAHPELRVQRGEAKPVTLEEIAGLLPDAQSALLEYVVTDEKTYLFVMSKGDGSKHGAVNLKSFTLPIKRKDLTDQVAAFRQQLAKHDLTFRPPASKLYELLLKPAQAELQGKQTLVIVPDGALWELPFQALLDAQGRYLIEDHTLSYAPSLTVLREMAKLRRQRKGGGASSKSLLAMGNPELGKETVERVNLVHRDERLEPLPEAEREVKILAQLYGAARSQVYVGAEAREDRVKAEAGRFGVMHLATHGILNDASPMYSQVVLAQSARDASEDGLLEAWEITKLDLKADLVVLSACETGRGRVGAGEGIIGLTWALFVAGSPTTVVSQWKVESASSTRLMLEFHRNLLSKTKKSQVSTAKALQEAAVKMLRSADYRHPFYWAGFVVVGDGG
jgi:CHAT domain-containing protein/Tfp pilus assembly protein PilF